MDNYKIAQEPSIVEESIIGCLLLNDSLMKEFYLQPKHFLNNYNKILISKMIDIKNEIGKVDLILLCNKLEHESYLCSLAMDYVTNIVSIDQFHYYQEKQHEIYKGYMINDVMQKFNDKKIDYNTMWVEINKINNESSSNDSSSSTMPSGKEIFELITTNHNELQFDFYKNILSPLKLPMKAVHLIAARTSQGKSALSLNFCNDLSKKYKCLYFNMEMTETELYQRLTSINCNIPINDFYEVENLPPKKQQAIWDGIEAVTKRNIKIYNGSKNVNALRTILAKESQKEHCIAFIDYIGYVYSKNGQNDRERIGEVVREIQTMTKELNITIFIVAQINREGNDAPTLVNLKDSGELEQSAHCVMLIHNPDKDNPNNLTPSVEIRVPKNRSGRLGKLEMVFNKPTQQFIPKVRSDD